MITRYLPWLDLRELSAKEIPRELAVGLVLTFLAVPQGVAYAMVAGLPPAVGLYASALPAIVAALFRSSRHVVVGPTNAISLVVGSTIALGLGADPLVVAVTLAFMVGVMQTTAGVLNLGALVDYISQAVVLGYITGAATLIGVGQLGHATGSDRGSGNLFQRLWGWGNGLDQAHLPSIAMALGSAAVLLAIRRWLPGKPAALMVMVGGIILSYAADLGSGGMILARDIAQVPAGLPPFTMPDLGLMGVLWPAAVAATMLSLVESSAVARTLASRTGQRLDTSVDFAGQGLANLAAAFTGGYPVSGSLARSEANVRAGAKSRLASLSSGVFVILVLLLLGPLVDWTPVPTLAGVLLVMAVDLIDINAIREVMAARIGDGGAFLATLVGTWSIPLDQAILLGAGISIVLFLRRVRHLVVTELVLDDDGRLRERDHGKSYRTARHVKVIHVEGNLFFGAATELQRALDDAARDPDTRVLVVRLKRTQGMDVTTAQVLVTAHEAMEREGRHMLLVGMRPRTMELLERTGMADEIGHEDLFPTRPGWFFAMNQALARATELAESPDDCPVRGYLASREVDEDVALD